jgi:voltage-gated potassium channel
MPEQPDPWVGQNAFMRFVLRKPLTPGRAGRSIALATLLVTLAAGVAMWLVDRQDFDNIGVGLWWSVQTVTTVGYGDDVPESVGGRILAAVVMLSGIGFLTVVTAAITATLIETVRRQYRDPTEERLITKLDEVLARIQALEDRLDRDPR